MSWRLGPYISLHLPLYLRPAELATRAGASRGQQAPRSLAAARPPGGARGELWQGGAVAGGHEFDARRPPAIGLLVHAGGADRRALGTELGLGLGLGLGFG